MKAATPGRPAGRLAWTEGRAPTLWWKWAGRSLRARPRCSSRSRPEFVQPLGLLGKEDSAFVYPTNQTKCVRKMLGKLRTFWLVSGGRDLSLPQSLRKKKVSDTCTSTQDGGAVAWVSTLTSILNSPCVGFHSHLFLALPCSW